VLLKALLFCVCG